MPTIAAIRTLITRDWGEGRGKSRSRISVLWVSLWATMLAGAWLAPNHYPPWSAFHADAWAAFMIGFAAIVAFLRFQGTVSWHRLTTITGVLVFLPLLQYMVGLLPYAGQAWIGTAYLLGLLLALLAGAHWETHCRGQLADGLFLAIGVASIASVGVQLLQWFNLDLLEIWDMGLAGRRPYANMGQPNLLGTLLLWGLLAVTWAYASEKLRAFFAISVAVFLLFGIALTQSRTAWLGLSLLVLASWVWRRLWPSKWFPFVVTALAAYFVLCNLALAWIVDVAQLSPELAGRSYGELRPAAWRLFIDAIAQRPWFGYGWSGVAKAQLAVALNHPPLGITFQHAHNLFLDLILWAGLPIGLVLSMTIVWWMFRCVRAIKTGQDLILLMFVVVVGNHAMLELPLHYAQFLLPTGLVIGMLNVRTNSPVLFLSPSWSAAVICLAGASLLALLVRDYLRVEDNYYALRFEKARIGTLPPREPPDVLLLTQLREELRLARFDPKSGMSESEISAVRNLAEARPGLREHYRLAKTLTLNGQHEEAQVVLKKICRIAPQAQCELARRAWKQESIADQRFASVAWPA